MVTAKDISTSLQSLHGEQWQVCIYRHYSGQEIYPDKNIFSPLRDNDSAASCRVFKVKDGDYLFHDYGRAITYNCFTFVHAYYENKDKVYTEFDMAIVCELINKDLGLGISDDPFDITIPSSSFSLSSREFKQSDPPLISVYPNVWGGVDNVYWGEYFITEEWLRFFDCGVSYKSLFSYDKGLVWKDYHTYKQKDPCYYYSFIDCNGRSKMKLLRPFANSDYKWRTNIDKRDLFSIQGFRQADLTQRKVVLTSSMKDVIILRMLGITAYALHGEAYLPTDEFIAHLKTHHLEVVVMMDNDLAGRTAASKILKLDPIFSREVYIPHGLMLPNNKESKDPSDYIKYSRGNFQYLKKLINL